MARYYSPHPGVPKASPVTVTKADGAVEVRPALGQPRPSVSITTQRAVFARDGLRCRYCGHEGPIGHFQIDHVVPVSAGGDNHHRNLVVACRQCNAIKGTETWKPRPIKTPGRLAIGAVLRQQGRTATEAKAIERAVRGRAIGMQHRAKQIKRREKELAGEPDPHKSIDGRPPLLPRMTNGEKAARAQRDRQQQALIDLNRRPPPPS